MKRYSFKERKKERRHNMSYCTLLCAVPHMAEKQNKKCICLSEIDGDVLLTMTDTHSYFVTFSSGRERSSQLVACPSGAEWAFLPGSRGIRCRYNMRNIPDTADEADCDYPEKYLAFKWSEEGLSPSDVCGQAFLSPNVPFDRDLEVRSICCSPVC